MKKLILALALFIAPLTSAHAFITVNPGSMEFGSVKIGTFSSLMFYVNNLGSDQVLINNCMAFSPFRCQLNCYGPLYPGQSCSGVIFFNPRSEKYELQTVILNSSQGTFSISVHGSGKI